MTTKALTLLEILLSDALHEMVEVYIDEETGGVPMIYADQPTQRAMDALRHTDGDEAVAQLGLGIIYLTPSNYSIPIKFSGNFQQVFVHGCNFWLHF